MVKYTDFSANFYQISISQPISLHSNALWLKKINTQLNIIRNVMLYRDMVDTKGSVQWAQPRVGKPMFHAGAD